MTSQRRHRAIEAVFARLQAASRVPLIHSAARNVSASRTTPRGDQALADRAGAGARRDVDELLRARVAAIRLGGCADHEQAAPPHAAPSTTRSDERAASFFMQVGSIEIILQEDAAAAASSFALRSRQSRSFASRAGFPLRGCQPLVFGHDRHVRPLAQRVDERDDARRLFDARAVEMRAADRRRSRRGRRLRRRAPRSAARRGPPRRPRRSPTIVSSGRASVPVRSLIAKPDPPPADVDRRARAPPPSIQML